MAIEEWTHDKPLGLRGKNLDISLSGVISTWIKIAIDWVAFNYPSPVGSPTFSWLTPFRWDQPHYCHHSHDPSLRFIPTFPCQLPEFCWWTVHLRVLVKTTTPTNVDQLKFLPEWGSRYSNWSNLDTTGIKWVWITPGASPKLDYTWLYSYIQLLPQVPSHWGFETSNGLLSESNNGGYLGNTAINRVWNLEWHPIIFLQAIDFFD